MLNHGEPMPTCNTCARPAVRSVYVELTPHTGPTERIMTLMTCAEESVYAFHTANRCKSTYSKDGAIQVGYTDLDSIT